LAMTDAVQTRPKMQTTIVMRAVCAEYGHCWSAMHPYYDKHYRTKKEAIAAARKIRSKLALKWGAR